MEIWWLTTSYSLPTSWEVDAGCNFSDKLNISGADRKINTIAKMMIDEEAMLGKFAKLPQY